VNKGLRISCAHKEGGEIRIRPYKLQRWRRIQVDAF
jgi:hypothetical protein